MVERVQWRKGPMVANLEIISGQCGKGCKGENGNVEMGKEEKGDMGAK